MNDQPFGIDNDYMPLRDILLGKPDYFRWVEAGPQCSIMLFGPCSSNRSPRIG